MSRLLSIEEGRAFFYISNTNWIEDLNDNSFKASGTGEAGELNTPSMSISIVDLNPHSFLQTFLFIQASYMQASAELIKYSMNLGNFVDREHCMLHDRRLVKSIN
jgi:arginine exporter protein ArgO